MKSTCLCLWGNNLQDPSLHITSPPLRTSTNSAHVYVVQKTNLNNTCDVKKLMEKIYTLDLTSKGSKLLRQGESLH
jgi:hypothetical protein